jgi:uncharacterized protein (DUF433 family)
MRIRVSDVLEMLAQGVPEAEILQDFPDQEAADIRAGLHFAATSPTTSEHMGAQTPSTLDKQPLGGNTINHTDA